MELEPERGGLERGLGRMCLLPSLGLVCVITRMTSSRKTSLGGRVNPFDRVVRGAVCSTDEPSNNSNNRL